MVPTANTAASTTMKLVIAYKIVLGVIECIFGLGLLLLELQLLTLYERWAAPELLQDPDDLLLNVTNHYIPYILEHRNVIAAVFIALGLAKILGGVGMIYKKEWARHLLIGFLLAFLPYDIVGLVRNPSVIEAFYFLFNVLLALYFMDFRPRQYCIDFLAFVKNAKLPPSVEPSTFRDMTDTNSSPQ